MPSSPEAKKTRGLERLAGGASETGSREVTPKRSTRVLSLAKSMLIFANKKRHYVFD